MKASLIYLLLIFFLSVSVSAQTRYQEADMFATKSPKDIFIGAVMEEGTINKDVHELIKVPLNEITVSYSLPISGHSLNPSSENMLNAVRERLKEKSPLKPNYSFSFSARELKSFSEVPIYFGQDINLSRFIGVNSVKKSKKTLMAISVSQSFFSINMDMQQHLVADPAVLQKYDQSKLIYVNSIEFGRRVFITLESNLSYNEVSQAVESAFKKEGLDEKSKAVLANCTVRIASFGNDLPPLGTENPFPQVIAYMSQPVTAENFGVPVAFRASYLKDNSSFVNKFSGEQ